MPTAARMKFVVVATSHNGGGCIALHALCKYLSLEGYDARVLISFTLPQKSSGLSGNVKKVLKYIEFSAKDFVKSFIARCMSKLRIRGWGLTSDKYRVYTSSPFKDCKRKWLPFVDDDTIVVYPEVIHGNFLRAKHVVRWLLYFNTFSDDGTAYGKNDLFFSYAQKFNDYSLNPSCRVCTVGYFDWELYTRTNFGERHGTCYIIRKGRNRLDLPKNFDGVVIDALPEQEKVKYFNQCEYCVSYDLYTAYSSIAAMLGCISVIVPESGKTRQDYGKAEQYGVAVGFDEAEIEFAKSTVGILAERFSKTEQRNVEHVKYFIEECRRYFHMS